MKEFTLNEDLSTRIFLKNFSKISDRFDAQFYWEDMNFDNCIKLSKIAKVSGGKRLPKESDYSNEKTGYRYLRIGDIDWNGQLNFKNFKNINEKTFKNLKRYEVKKNDLLLAIVGTIGKCALLNPPYDDRIILTENCAKIQLKSNDILPEYLYIILQTQFVQKQMQLNYIQTTLPKLGLDRVLSLRLPKIPSKERQNEIVDLFYNGIRIRNEKLTKAQTLLNSIDDYLLKELGITLPEQNHSLENRMFITNFSKVSGGRFDPKLYDNNTQALIEAIDKGRYEKVALKDLVIHSAAGDWGKDENFNLPAKDYQKCLVIRATEFNNIYNLSIEGKRAKHRQIKKAKLQKLDMQPNDFLVEKSGGSPDQPVGRIALLREEYFEQNELCYSNFIHKFRTDTEKIDPEYLFAFLKTMHNIKLTEAMQSQTNGIRNLIMKEYFSQTIVLPPIEKQKEIANKIQGFRAEAKQLQQEAAAALEYAKKEVEKMILGE